MDTVHHMLLYGCQEPGKTDGVWLVRVSDSSGRLLRSATSLTMSHNRIYVAIMRCKDGAWWLSGRFGALCPEGRKFEYPSSRHVGTLGKIFTRSCLQCFGC